MLEMYSEKNQIMVQKKKKPIKYRNKQKKKEQRTTDISLTYNKIIDGINGNNFKNIPSELLSPKVIFTFGVKRLL